jgi:cation transporter-like permease
VNGEQKMRILKALIQSLLITFLLYQFAQFAGLILEEEEEKFTGYPKTEQCKKGCKV